MNLTEVLIVYIPEKGIVDRSDNVGVLYNSHRLLAEHGIKGNASSLVVFFV